MILLGFSNLRRTKLRTFLTTLGVVIGIGTLTSMVSFGTGMQKNITDTFQNNDLFTSLTITPEKIDLENLSSGDPAAIEDIFKSKPILLTDSVLETIRKISGVEVAYPNITFPAKIKIENDSTNTNIQAMPARMRNYKPFNDLLAGTFFTSDSSKSIVIRQGILRRLNIILDEKNSQTTLSSKDSAEGKRILPPDSIIGKTIKLISVTINPSKVPAAMIGFLSKNPEMPFDEIVNEYKICGILKKASSFGSNFFRGGVIIPVKTAEEIPRLGFSSVWELLNKKQKKGSYSSIHVKLSDISRMDKVRKELENMSLNVFSISDQLKEIKRAFLIFDTILGAIGAIALIVAGLGIINTMVMSILERKREIGIMKAIGGSEKDIKMIFFVEAAVIGFTGAIFGLVLGWIVTRIANLVVNSQIVPQGELPVNLFYFPWWLIFGAILFSLLISLAAGLYPAIHAARIDPVRALRHD